MDKREKDSIKAFIQSDSKVMTSDDGQFNYIKVPNQKDPKKLPSIFRINTEHTLGSGSFGSVYPAERVEVKQNKQGQITSLNIQKTDFVVKKIRGNLVERESIKEEAGFLSQHFRTSKAIANGDYSYIVTERLHGQELEDFIETEEFNTLTLSDRLKLVNEVLFDLNLIHHNTVKTKEALLHKDIKPANIMLNIKKLANGTTKFNARIIDYGIATTENNDDHSEQKTSTDGTTHYIAPEIFQEKGSIKSDVFSMSAVIAEIMGVSFSVLNEDRIGLGEKFPFDIFTKKPESDPLHVIGKFLNKMQAKDAADRPDTETCMKFFLTMQRHASIAEKLENKPSTTVATEKKEKKLSTRIANFFKKLLGLKPTIKIEKILTNEQKEAMETEMQDTLQKANAIIADPAEKEWLVVSNEKFSLIPASSNASILNSLEENPASTTSTLEDSGLDLTQDNQDTLDEKSKDYDSSSSGYGSGNYSDSEAEEETAFSITMGRHQK